nr:DsrE family protein [Nocardioides pocheonensis]
MKSVLLVINGPAYGSDETYNAVRLAVALARREDVEVSVFLMGDAVTCAIAGQKTPDGYYQLDRMLQGFARHGGRIACLRNLSGRARVGCLAPDRGGQPIDHGRACRLGRRS